MRAWIFSGAVLLATAAWACSNTDSNHPPVAQMGTTPNLTGGSTDSGTHDGATDAAGDGSTDATPHDASDAAEEAATDAPVE
jgi:hypothetical protein